MELPFFFFFFSFLWGEWDRIKKGRGRVTFLVMARYDLHPIGHDGSIVSERERQRSIGTSRFLRHVQSACVVGWLVGRSLNEREPYLPQEGKVWALFLCVCVCVYF